MSHAQHQANAVAKASRVNCQFTCGFVIADCHATLNAGGYSVDHPYGQKLWAEIDAYRDRQMALARSTKVAK